MTDETQDIFGKIDALQEKRAGFGARPSAAEEDFPLLTEVVDARQEAGGERRRGERRLGIDRRQADRRRADEGRAAPPTLSDEQFGRFLNLFEQKLEDLFIRQQLRLEESIRRVLREVREEPQGDPD